MGRHCESRRACRLCVPAAWNVLFRCSESKSARPFHMDQLHCGLQLCESDANALISLTSKFNCGLGPKGGLILATSPVHFYLTIKGPLGSVNRRCISMGAVATTSNKQDWRSLCWILGLISLALLCSLTHWLPGGWFPSIVTLKKLERKQLFQHSDFHFHIKFLK